MRHVGKDSPIDDLAETLSGLRAARDVASSADDTRILIRPRRLYPMSLVASQLTINPFEFFVLIALLITGFAYTVLGVKVPGSISALLPEAWTMVWILNVSVGSLLALVGGLFRRNPDWGLLMYQLGWGLCGIAAAVYGVAVLLAFPVIGLYPGLTNLLIATACLVRVVQIQRFFRVAELIRRGLLRVPYFYPVDPPGGDQDADDPHRGRS